MVAAPLTVQFELLYRGDAQERVWAAWSLGLALGSRALASLVYTVRNDPDPGVRRHVVVMMAGFGRRDVLDQIATEESDDRVRAVAWAQLATLAMPKDVALYDRLGWCLHREVPRVRVAVVMRLRNDAPVFVKDCLLRLASDSHSDVRAAVIAKSAMFWSTVGSRLVARAEVERDPTVKVLLQRCLRDRGLRPRSAPKQKRRNPYALMCL